MASEMAADLEDAGAKLQSLLQPLVNVRQVLRIHLFLLRQR